MRKRQQALQKELQVHSTIMTQLQGVFPTIRTIQDAKTPIGIHVSEADIAAAVPGNPAMCAVALGARRELEVTGAVISRTVAVLVYNGTHAVRYHVPGGTRERLFAFDLAGVAEPGIYMLGAVPKARRLSEMQRRQNISRTRIKRSPKRGKQQGPRNAPITKLRIWGGAQVPAATSA